MALRSRVLAAVAAALPLALAAGCSGGAAPGEASAALASPGAGIPAGPANGPQSLSETGSTLLFPVLRTWAAAYRQQHANVSIATAATGSGKGIAEASAGAVDIGASDAYLSSGDLVTNPAMVNIPLAVSAQQVNYNVPGLRPATHLKLNGKVLAEMYQGAITSWSDPRIAALNPRVALPHTRVVPLHRADSAGDTFLFTSYLSTQDAVWDRVTGYGTTVDWPHVLGERAETGNTGMVAGCKATPGCVAYVGIAYLSGHYFQLVWTVDHAYIGAVFGLARTRLAAGDPAAAIAALAAVPDTSSHHLAAQVAAVRIQVSPRPGQAQVSPGDLGEAGARVDRLKLDAIQMEYLTAEVLRAALGCAQAGGAVPGGRLLGCEFTERGLRFGLERSYRAQARLAPDRRRRIELVEAANSVRPRTWI